MVEHLSNMWKALLLSTSGRVGDKVTLLPGMVVAHHYIPALGRLRQEDHHKYKASLGYTEIFRPA